MSDANPKDPESTSPGKPRQATSSPPRSSHRGRKFLIWSVLLLLAAAGYWWFRQHYPGKEQQPGAAPPEPPPVPVVAGRVTQRDVPIYLDGLGTVQALNTVTVRVRVDGELVKLAFKEGQNVKAGDLLAKIDARPFEAQLAQAQAKKQQDEAQLANARLDLKRNTLLLAQRAIAQQSFDTQKTLVAQFEATVKGDQAAIESAQIQLGYTSIYSPIDGRTGIRLVDQGNIVHAADPTGLVVITQLRPIFVVFTLPEQNLSAIQEQRQKEPFTVLALGRENAKPLATGTLSVIDNQIDTTTGTIRMKAMFPNEDERLWPGQFVNVRLLLTTRKNATVIPATAVQRGPEGMYVFVIKKGLTVEVRPVKVGQTQAGETLIENGLWPGERVVAEGYYRLQANSRVKVASPAPEAPKS